MAQSLTLFIFEQSKNYLSNLIVPSLVLKCREMVAIKRMLWKELKSSWKSTTGLNRLVEQLMNMEGSANSDVTNSTVTIEGKGETSLVSELGLIDPIVVNLLRKNTILEILKI